MGEDELKNNLVTVKFLRVERAQETVGQDELVDFILPYVSDD